MNSKYPKNGIARLRLLNRTRDFKACYTEANKQKQAASIVFSLMFTCQRQQKINCRIVPLSCVPVGDYQSAEDCLMVSFFLRFCVRKSRLQIIVPTKLVSASYTI